MPSVGLIINERSKRTPSIIDDLLYVAGRSDELCTYVLDGVRGLGKALAGMNRRNIDTLIIAGGDGTVQATLTDIVNNNRFDVAPNYVALPCGMTNVIASDCGLKGAPAGSLEKFLWRRKNGSIAPLKRPVLKVSRENDTPVYGFFLGAGVFSPAVEFSRTKVQKLGLAHTMSLLFSVYGYILKLVLDTKSLEGELSLKILEADDSGLPETSVQTLFLLTTLSRLGPGIFPFWGEGDGAIAGMTVPFPPRRLLRAAFTGMRSKSQPWFKEYGYHSWRTNKMIIQMDAPFVFDGELFHAEEQRPTTFETSHVISFLN